MELPFNFMKNSLCSSCRLPKATLECELCHALQCKKCVQILKKDSFGFLKSIPENLTHRHYCGSCFDEKVGPELISYENTMERAKNIMVFFRTQSEETRLIRRIEKPIKVTDCNDRDETILRLAFFTAEANYNALVDVVVTSEKVRNEGYQKTKWQGVGVPVQLDGKKYKND